VRTLCYDNVTNQRIAYPWRYLIAKTSFPWVQRVKIATFQLLLSRFPALYPRLRYIRPLPPAQKFLSRLGGSTEFACMFDLIPHNQSLVFTAWGGNIAIFRESSWNIQNGGALAAAGGDSSPFTMKYWLYFRMLKCTGTTRYFRVSGLKGFE